MFAEYWHLLSLFMEEISREENAHLLEKVTDDPGDSLR